MTATTTELATRPTDSLSASALSYQDILAQKKLIAEVMREVMKEGEHYGVIPGTGKRKNADGVEVPPKPSLLKPGADTIGFMFRLEADYVAEEVIHEPGYIYYRYKCVLTHIPTGKRVGSGIGSCNSREEKYRRAAPKVCPRCSKETIIKGREEYGGGWLCFGKKGGCGAKWPDGDAEIEQQPTGVADPSDLDNTICKMALKRSRIDAILTTTAASDFFSQDVEDLQGKAAAIDVEATPVASPKGEAPARRSESPTPSTPPSGGATSTATKPLKAPQVPHDGTFASASQVKLLHTLKSKAGLGECKGDCEQTVEKHGKWGKPTQQTIRCPYHTQLAAFKDCDGKPITTSTDLSAKQISNLIDRYEAKVGRQERKAAEVPDVGGRPPHVEAISNAMRSKPMTEQEVRQMFGVDDIADLDQQQAANALALVLASDNPEMFDRIREGMRTGRTAQ